MMTLTIQTTSAAPRRSTSSGYQPGTCNIGAPEIARRRRAGHIALAAAFVLLVVLVAIGAPPLTRLLLVLPAAAAASGYLQAHFRFCAGFGSRGIYNFGDVGTTQEVVDPDARRRDRGRARQIGLASLAIGVVVGMVAVVLPL